MLAVAAFMIAPGPLAGAFRELGTQSNMQILFSEDEFKGLGTLGFKCQNCSVRDAILGLIDGQDITWSWTRALGDPGLTIVFRRRPPPQRNL